MDDTDDAAPGGRIRFPFAHDAPCATASLLFGVTPGRAWLELDGEWVEARFGPWVVRTPLANVAWVEVTGPYHWWKVVGPARGSFADRGLTFATTTRGGVCLGFHEPVPGIELSGRVRHPGLTVTVADPEAVAAELCRRLGADG